MSWRLRSSLFKFVALATVMLAGAASARESLAQTNTLLRWKLKPGDKLPLVVTEELKVTQRANDKDMQTIVSQQVDLTWTVTEVDAQEIASISQQIDRVRCKLVQAGVDAGPFDTAASEPPAGPWATLGPVLKSMVGADFALKMNARGEILDLAVPQQTVDAVARLPKVGQLREFFSAEGMKQLIGGSLVVLPEEAVPPGHAWTVTRNARNPLAGPQIVTAAFTYVGPEQRAGRQLQKITIDLDTLPNQSAGVNPQLQAAQVKQQDGKGVVYFDSAAGRLVESELQQAMTMTITFGAASVDQQVETLVRVTAGK